MAICLAPLHNFEDTTSQYDWFCMLLLWLWVLTGATPFPKLAKYYTKLQYWTELLSSAISVKQYLAFSKNPLDNWIGEKH